MLEILAISTAVTVVTIILMAVFIGVANAVLKREAGRLGGNFRLLGAIAAVTFVTSWLLLALTVTLFLTFLV